MQWSVVGFQICALQVSDCSWEQPSVCQQLPGGGVSACLLAMFAISILRSLNVRQFCTMYTMAFFFMHVNACIYMGLWSSLVL